MVEGQDGEDGQMGIPGPQGPQGAPGQFIPGMDGQDGEDSMILVVQQTSGVAAFGPAAVASITIKDGLVVAIS